MPINTYICPNCGARINHTMRYLSDDLFANEEYRGEDVTDEDNPQTSLPVEEHVVAEVYCPRCKQRQSLYADDISQRTLADMNALDEFDMVMADDSSVRDVLEDDGGDAVEAALDKADAVFENARRALDDIRLEDVSSTIDADKLLQRYQIPDVKNFAINKIHDKAAVKAEAHGIPRQDFDEAYNTAASILTRHINWDE